MIQWLLTKKETLLVYEMGSHGRRSQFQASKMTAYDHIFFATKQTIEKYVVRVKYFFFDISEMGDLLLYQIGNHIFLKRG